MEKGMFLTRRAFNPKKRTQILNQQNQLLFNDSINKIMAGRLELEDRQSD
ncbi:hypothetical protein LguiB_003891 [Lonicera macranthoides]